MDLSSPNIKSRSLELIGDFLHFVKTYWLLIIVAVLAVWFAIIQTERYLDRRAAEREAAHVAEMDDERKKNAAQTAQMFEIFNKHLQNTQNTLDALNAFNGTISQLVANDKRQDETLKNFKQEYEYAKNPQSKQNIIIRNARRRLPVNQRENDALSADRELYPAAGNGSNTANGRPEKTSAN